MVVSLGFVASLFHVCANSEMSLPNIFSFIFYLKGYDSTTIPDFSAYRVKFNPKQNHFGFVRVGSTRALLLRGKMTQSSNFSRPRETDPCRL